MWFGGEGPGGPGGRMESCMSDPRVSLVNRASVRFGVAALAVAAAFGLRQAVLALAGGDLPTYITFYPAVMLAAIVGGLWPGLLATALTGLVVAYWVLPPEGLAIASPSHLIALGIFSAMGALLSLLTDLYRRNRSKAADYEKQLVLRESELRHRDQVHQAQQQAQAVLEDRVAQRTAELQKSQEDARLLAAIVESSEDAITGKTLDGVITSWNRAAERIYGYTTEEILGKSMAILTAPDRPNELPEILEKVRQGQRVEHYETLRVRKDGRCIGVSLTISPIKDDQGCIIGASTISRDVSQRRRLEEELRAASLYARSLIEASLDPLVTISPLGKITDVNKATELATGCSRQQLIGSDFSRYFTEPSKADAGYQKVLSDGFVRDYPLTIRHASGRTLDVLYNATVYRNEAGRVQGVFAAARDVTDRKHIEEELRLKSLYARSLIEASLDPLVTISPDGKITDVNTATEQATGVPREHLIGSDFSRYFTEPAKADEGYQKVISAGYVRDYPLTIRHTSGRTMDVLYNATVYTRRGGHSRRASSPPPATSPTANASRRNCG